tara:strand:- start:1712 stop:2155 length:444 start_codon:yes stop_codon:yes gene_type:complete
MRKIKEILFLTCSVIFLYGCEIENEYSDTTATIDVDMSSYLEDAIDNCYTSTSSYKITVRLYGVDADNQDYDEEINIYETSYIGFDDQFDFTGFSAGGSYNYDVYYNGHKARSTYSLTLNVEDIRKYATLNRFSGWTTWDGEFDCVY